MPAKDRVEDQGNGICLVKRDSTGELHLVSVMLVGVLQLLCLDREQY